VSAGQLRYGSFGGEPDALRFHEYHSVELSPELFQPGLLGGTARDGEALKARVAALCERLSAPAPEAALVLPDAWLRLAFTESGELPPKPADREEVLRFKLKRLVPYRVEDLRVSAVEVEPLPAQEEPRRLLLAFGLEALFAQWEETFAALGVRLGQITNHSLALVRVAPAGGTQLEGLVLAAEDGYSLVFARGGQPVLQRFKAFSAELPAQARGEQVVRELRLTISFLAEQLPGMPLGTVLLWAPPHLQELWRRWSEAGLGRAATVLERQHLPVDDGDLPAVWHEAVPLLGAVAMEVA
jgi:type IV pilus assembly protein PilM